MKARLLAAALAVVLSLSLFVGCSDNGDADITTTTEATTTTTEETTTTVEEETTSTEEGKVTTSQQSTTKKKTTTQSTATTVTYRTLAPTTTVVNVTGSTTTTRKTMAPRVTTTTKDWSHIFPVKVTESIEQRAAAVNNNLNGKQPVKIASEKATVTEYNKEWGFTHHPGLAYFKGKWYASFSQGHKDEDAPGQRAVVASSADFFNWSEPVVVGDCLESDLVPGTLTSNIPGPVYVCGDKLFMVYGATSYPPSKFDSQGRFQANNDLSGTTSKGFVRYTEDGVNWSEPSPYSGGGWDTLRQTVTGRWFLSYGKSVRYSDDPNPNGLYWLSGGLSASQIADATARNNGATLTESSWFQTKDNVLHVMVRSDNSFLWMMESYDNGKTWTDLYPTNFGSASTMWKFGELPDGRIYGVGTSGDKNTSRNKLELWISEDGVNFDKCYIIRDEAEPAQKGWGWATGGRYGYPSVQIRDGYLHVLYSRHKEFMEVSRVKLSDIQ